MRKISKYDTEPQSKCSGTAITKARGPVFKHLSPTWVFLSVLCDFAFQMTKSSLFFLKKNSKIHITDQIKQLKKMLEDSGSISNKERLK